MTIVPDKPYVGMLSIPRDLWVTIPGVGENRINTAHYYAEIEDPGSGPAATLETVEENFGVDVDHYVRIRFESITQLVDTLGGLDIELEQPTSIYDAGKHHLNGEQALAFLRDRSGSDDFFRMSRGQIFIKALLNQILTPSTWRQWPAIYSELKNTIQTDIPIWKWPRLGVALFRSIRAGIDNRIITREMVQPFTTDGGAQVLDPQWSEIKPILKEMLGQVVP